MPKAPFAFDAQGSNSIGKTYDYIITGDIDCAVIDDGLGTVLKTINSKRPGRQRAQPAPPIIRETPVASFEQPAPLPRPKPDKSPIAQQTPSPKEAPIPEEPPKCEPETEDEYCTTGKF